MKVFLGMIFIIIPCSLYISGFAVLYSVMVVVQLLAVIKGADTDSRLIEKSINCPERAFILHLLSWSNECIAI